MSAALVPGFSDSVLEAQRTFRATMDALARPGTLAPLLSDLKPPAPLTPELAALALTLTDADTPIWLSPSLARPPAVVAYLRFHTGAPIVAEPSDAAFALVGDAEECPSLTSFAIGSPEYPDRSTTVILAVAEFAGGPGLSLRGPGIEGEAALRVSPLPPDFLAQTRANRRLFPRGVDVLLVAPGLVAGMPRSSEISAGEG